MGKELKASTHGIEAANPIDIAKGIYSNYKNTMQNGSTSDKIAATSDMVGLAATAGFGTVGDAIAFGSSVTSFIAKPSWSGLGDVGLDAIGLLPFLAATGTINRVKRTINTAQIIKTIDKGFDSAEIIKKGLTKALSQNKNVSNALRYSLNKAADLGVGFRKEIGEGFAAHHIIPVGMGNNRSIVKLQDMLAGFGIDINSAANGVFLPTSAKSAVGEFANAAIHSGNNGPDYIEYLTDTFQNVTSKEQAVSTLNNVRKELLNGTLKINKAK